jgi:hypothetical protein
MKSLRVTWRSSRGGNKFSSSHRLSLGIRRLRHGRIDYPMNTIDTRSVQDVHLGTCQLYKMERKIYRLTKSLPARPSQRDPLSTVVLHVHPALGTDRNLEAVGRLYPKS